MGRFVSFNEYRFVEPDAVPAGAERVRNPRTLAMVHGKHRDLKHVLAISKIEVEDGAYVQFGLSSAASMLAKQDEIRSMLDRCAATEKRHLLVRVETKVWIAHLEAKTEEDRAEELRHRNEQ